MLYQFFLIVMVVGIGFLQGCQSTLQNNSLRQSLSGVLPSTEAKRKQTILFKDLSETEISEHYWIYRPRNSLLIQNDLNPPEIFLGSQSGGELQAGYIVGFSKKIFARDLKIAWKDRDETIQFTSLIIPTSNSGIFKISGDTTFGFILKPEANPSYRVLNTLILLPNELNNAWQNTPDNNSMIENLPNQGIPQQSTPLQIGPSIYVPGLPTKPLSGQTLPSHVSPSETKPANELPKASTIPHNQTENELNSSRRLPIFDDSDSTMPQALPE
ncbi:MAG: hypothetical protein V4629_00640 [Pseudomonadota bacterium]